MRVRSWLTLLFLLLVTGTAGTAEPAPVKKVLLIGIDGCRPDALQTASAPHLAALARDGAYSYKAQTGDVTVSGPGWSSMLTGVWRGKHGVRDNKFESANFGEYPHFFRRLKQVRPQAYTASVVHWEPIHSKIVAAADVSVAFKKDAEVAATAAKILAEREPDVLFVHFDEVDHAGHKYGFSPQVRPYLKAIEQADALVGKLLQAVRSRKSYAREDWLILVSTDHGGSGKGHGRNVPEHRTIFVIVSGPSAQHGEIETPPGVVDVAATALRHLGVPIEKRWGLDGRAVGLRQSD